MHSNKTSQKQANVEIFSSKKSDPKCQLKFTSTKFLANSSKKIQLRKIWKYCFGGFEQLVLNYYQRVVVIFF